MSKIQWVNQITVSSILRCPTVYYIPFLHQNQLHFYMGHTKYIRVIFPFSVGFRTNEALCQLIYEATYLGPEGDRPGRHTQAVRHTCSGNLRIVEILRCFRSDKFKIPPHKQKSIVKNFFWKEDIPPGQRGPVLKHNGKSGTVCICR